MSALGTSASLPPPAILVDTGRWPLIYVRFRGSVDGPVMDQYLSDLTRAITQRPGKRAMVMDATECGMVSAAARKKQADWMLEYDENTRLFTMGIAFVLPSPLLRGALTAVLWLQPLPCPYAVVKDVATGEDRCASWLAPHGLAFPR